MYKFIYNLFTKLFFVLAVVSCEIETSKTLATQKCALSMVSQLCSCGQIERNLSAQKKKEKVNFAHEVFQVDVNEKLVNDVYSILNDLNIIPMIDVSMYDLNFYLLLHNFFFLKNYLY